MKATTSVDIIDEVRPAPEVEMEASRTDELHAAAPLDSTISSTNDAASDAPATSAGDTTSLSSASPSASASAGDSMDAPVACSIEVNTAVQSRAMRRCVSDVGLEPQVPIFPNLPDSYLEELALVYTSHTIHSEPLSDQDTENKFVSVSLAIRTDRLTLDSRHEQQKRLRDQAKRNVEQEATNLYSALHKLNYLCTDSESIDILSNIKEQLNFLLSAVEYMSGSAESLGAVCQESRVSRAWDVAVAHVENVKLMLENARTDLEDTKRMISDKQRVTMGDIVNSVQSGAPRPRSTHDRPGANRRASIAAIARHNSPATHPLNGRSLFSENARFRDSGNREAVIKSRGLETQTIPEYREGSSRSSFSLRMPFSPASHSDGTPFTLDSSDLTETSDSFNVESTDDIKDSRAVNKKRRSSEENNNCQMVPDELSNSFLTPDIVDTGGEKRDLALPQVEDDNLMEEPITLHVCNQMPPTLRWLREGVLSTRNVVSSLTDNFVLPDMEVLIHSGRKFVVGLLLLAAAWCIVQIFVPASAYPYRSIPFSWATWKELIEPWVQVHSYKPPPS